MSSLPTKKIKQKDAMVDVTNNEILITSGGMSDTGFIIRKITDPKFKSYFSRIQNCDPNTNCVPDIECSPSCDPDCGPNDACDPTTLCSPRDCNPDLQD
jgi:hypothetical protein